MALPTTATVKRIELRLRHLAAARMFHPTDLNALLRGLMSVDIEEGPQYFDEIMVRLLIGVYTQELHTETKTLSVRTPADWWQHLKLRWFPAWALKRWPARYDTVQETYKFDVEAWYPNVELIPDQPVRYIQTLETVPYQGWES